MGATPFTSLPPALAAARSGLSWTVKEYVAVTTAPAASVAVTVNVTTPVRAGTPLTVIVPVPPPEIVTPAWLFTFDRFSATPVVPPAVVMVWPYDCPPWPFGSVVRVMTSAESTANV